LDVEGVSVAHAPSAQEAPRLRRVDTGIEEPLEQRIVSRAPPAREQALPAPPGDLLDLDVEGEEIKIDLDSVAFTDEIEPAEARAESRLPTPQNRVDAPTGPAGSSSPDEEALTPGVELEGEEPGENRLRLEEEPLSLPSEDEGLEIELPVRHGPEEPALAGAVELEEEEPIAHASRSVGSSAA